MTNNTLEYADLLKENSKILLRFENEGLDPKKTRILEFGVSVPEKNDAIAVRQAFRDKFQVPKEGMFIVINDPKDYQLVLSVEMRPSAAAITEIENQLLESAKCIGSAEVFWGFEEK